ncbi:MAG: hypothetical protein ACK4N5_19115, partial [Myxococcales bacterium]
MGIFFLQCGTESGRLREAIRHEDPDAPDYPGTDDSPRITVFAPGEDQPDGGTAPPDGGTYTPPDAGVPPVPPVTWGDWTHYNADNLAPQDVRDVSGDESGNVWVAGWDALYVLRDGQTMFERFSQAEG